MTTAAAVDVTVNNASDTELPAVSIINPATGNVSEM